MNNINALPLLEFCSRDMTTVRITYSSRGWNQGELVVMSAYPPYNSSELPPTKGMRDVFNYCNSSSSSGAVPMHTTSYWAAQTSTQQEGA
jgi:hypothetical protein